MAGVQRPDAGLIADLEAARLHPLWDRYARITPAAPAPSDTPFMWRWKDVAPFAARAAAEVAMEDAERRALILAHPAFGGETRTTRGLLAAFTVLEPGDRALPHRHTAAAIRFSTQAEGAVTFVDGRRCEMLPGDLVLTPPWVWHGHVNESGRRTVWFDAADMPLVNRLDANFFDPGDRTGDGGLSEEGKRDAPNPVFRHPGEETRRRLSGAPPRDDGARVVRYADPSTGGAVTRTLDCCAVRLSSGRTTRARRATWSAVVLVVSGEGTSEIGGERIAWSANDVFTVPHWTWAAHTATGGEADLFVVTDREAMRRLGMVREEVRA